MMGLKIWQKYFFKEIVKIFVLFLFSFYFLFVILDASSHVQDFVRESKLQIKTAILYYLFQFIKYSDILIPLAALISTIKVLCSFNLHRELVALQTSGVKTGALMAPFLLMGACCSLFMYANFEAITPKALQFIQQFYQSHLHHSYRGNQKEPIHVLHLKDNTKLIYQTTTPSKDYFFDLLWVRSFDDVVRMKYLKTDPQKPEAFFVDFIKRNAQGELEKVGSENYALFHDLKWDAHIAGEGKVPIERCSLSELISFALHPNTPTPYQRSEITTHLLFKLLMPLLSILAVISVAPFCVKYSRNVPVFFIYCIALFAFISFFTLIDACAILGENGVLPPLGVLGLPFALPFALFGMKYVRA